MRTFFFLLLFPLVGHAQSEYRLSPPDYSNSASNSANMALGRAVTERQAISRSVSAQQRRWNQSPGMQGASGGDFSLQENLRDSDTRIESSQRVIRNHDKSLIFNPSLENPD